MHELSVPLQWTAGLELSEQDHINSPKISLLLSVVAEAAETNPCLWMNVDAVFAEKLMYSFSHWSCERGLAMVVICGC